MTATLSPAAAGSEQQTEGRETIHKVSIIVSHGSLEGIYPGLIMANGARMEGIEANLFFTFFGLDAITMKKQHKIKVATVGNPALGIPTLLGALPGMSTLATRMMGRKMERWTSRRSRSSSSCAPIRASGCSPARRRWTCSD